MSLELWETLKPVPDVVSNLTEGIDAVELPQLVQVVGLQELSTP